MSQDKWHQRLLWLAIGAIIMVIITTLLSPFVNEIRDKFTSTPLSTQQSPQYIHIGGLDLNAYCQSLGYVQDISDGNRPQDWHCLTQAGTHLSINLTDACRWQYHRSDVVAVIQDETNTGGAQCYTSS